MYIAAYGPRALGVAGRVGDGVIIQLADPVIIQWIMEQARAAAAEAGRDPDALECIVCAPSIVTENPGGPRRRPLVPGDGLEPRHGPDRALRRALGDPDELTDYVKARKFYDYKDHSREGAAHGEFVTDEIADRFSVIERRRSRRSSGSSTRSASTTSTST